MPTPVTIARQCLAPEAASALDAAAVIASRRGHVQTTSLHMVASLLSLPSSRLRESCLKARNSSCPARFQFKALELSLGVSLDRFPSTAAAKIEEPPVANSLMAAIKRSQANQRRQPECFGLYHQQPQQCSYAASSVAVKVEIRNLVFSILDDPLVSRVFGDAGFRSYDIKLAALKQDNSYTYNSLHHFGNSSRYKRLFTPSYFNNMNTTEFGYKSYKFPFMCGDENSTKIGEVMVRMNKRNPILIGISAGIALKAFLEALKRKNVAFLPTGLTVRVVCVENELLRFVNGDDVQSLELRLEEVEKILAEGSGKRVVLNLGDLKAMAGEGVGNDVLRSLLGKFGRLLKGHVGQVWLIGAVAGYEVCNWILNKVPSIEEEWDLEILPITSSKSIFMESFVPLGGFFSMPLDTKGSVSHCCLGDEKYNPDRNALSNIERDFTIKKAGADRPSTEQGDKNLISCISTNIQQNPSSKELCSYKSGENSSKFTSRSGVYEFNDDQASLNSVTSVTTDLCLGVIHDSSSSFPVNADSNTNFKELKNLRKCLVERVGHQEAAITSIVEALSQRRTKQGREDVWINIRGPDELSKKKLGLALAEALYGSTERFIYANLDFQDKTTDLDTVQHLQIIHKYDLKMRGSVVDYIVEKLSKNPGIVFLENIDMSDPVVQNALSWAVKTGRLTDLHGREVNTRHSIFVQTMRFLESSEGKYTVEDVLKAKGNLIQLCVGYDVNRNPRVDPLDLLSMNKRKVLGNGDIPDLKRHREATKRAHTTTLDLNLPALESKTHEKGSSCEILQSWLDDFEREIDRVVAFNPFDFDEVADKLYKQANEYLNRIVGFDCTMEIERPVMQQLLAAAYVYDYKSVEDWIRRVLGKGFMEAIAKFCITARSVVKIVAASEGSHGDEKVEGMLLPSRIGVK